MTTGRLIIVGGLPGSGKTTLAVRLASELAGVRLCPDEWMAALGIDLYDADARARIEALQRQVAGDVLVGGGVAIVEWGTWGRGERDELHCMARTLGAAGELRWLEVGIDELWRRVQVRKMEERLGVRPLTRADLDAAIAAAESPTAVELARYDPPLTP